jgi:hypothetical protein
MLPDHFYRSSSLVSYECFAFYRDCIRASGENMFKIILS